MDLMEALRSKRLLWLEARHAAAEANTPAALMAVCAAEVDELTDGQAPEAAPRRRRSSPCGGVRHGEPV